MNRGTLADAIAEAEKFLAVATHLEQKHQEYWEAIKKDPEGWYSNPITGSPESATVKRRSMDLSRALAALRKYG